MADTDHIAAVEAHADDRPSEDRADSTAIAEAARPRSRRSLLAGAVGGLAGLLAARLGSPDSTDAAAGANLIIGNTSNDAGTSNTTLTTNSTGTGLLVTQNGTGTALRGSAVGPGSIAGFFTANNGTGVSGVTGTGGTYGVFATNNGAAGTGGALRASGVQNHGIVATTANGGKYAVLGTGAGGTGIFGSAVNFGVEGAAYRGVYGHTTSSGAASGVWGRASGAQSDTYGVLAETDGTGNSVGVWGQATGATGVVYGVKGTTSSVTDNAAGVFGTDSGGAGITNGVQGVSSSSDGNGVFGQTTTDSASAFAVYGTAAGAGFGVVGFSSAGTAIWAQGNAQVDGNLNTNGVLSKGSGTFRIDHPLDPANKFLLHSFVESPDMMNVYNGVTKLDSSGTATVSLPDWFEALNRDFRYQLTAIGAAAPNLHIGSGVKNQQFVIAGGPAGTEVSWQVTGIRQDAFANAHRVKVEVAKTGKDKGRYLHPVEHGKPKSLQLGPTHRK